MPNWLTILIAVLGTLATMGGLLASIAYFIGTWRKSNADLWRQNSEAFEKANAQKDRELAELKQRVSDLETEQKRMKHEYGEVIRLNIELQLSVEKQEGLISALRLENRDLRKGMNIPPETKIPEV